MPQSASQPRTRCRLPCTITRGRKRIHARVLDVSEGGLCIVTPVRFPHQSTIEVVIEVPRRGPVAVEGVVWHERRFSQPLSGRRGWATGLVLSKAGPDFHAIAKPAGAFLEPSKDEVLELLKPATLVEDLADVQALELEANDEPQVFRVRLKAAGSTRTRVLTLSAHSEAAVREAVLTDLSGDWEIIDVEANPLD